MNAVTEDAPTNYVSAKNVYRNDLRAIDVPASDVPASDVPASDLPVQPSLRRMRLFEVRPDRELGQNFLIDSNILGVIDRAAELGPDDVVLEIGGGLGVLSEYLAQRVEHVHVVEVDERLRGALEDAVDPFGRSVTVHWADAMKLDLGELRPAPTKLVANLPYGIAAGALLRTIEDLPAVRLWVAMVQREVGERLASSPGSGVYGVPSVIAQLACEVQVLRMIPRTVFRPEPNVDSVLLGMRRHGPAAGASLRALVGGAFAHRRKTLAGSLALAGSGTAGSGTAGSATAGLGTVGPETAYAREDVRNALVELGYAADARAERLAPEDFRALGRALGV
jgi:16S rRNA (adenine1518-N6/adenine1519-N6)-dimethyltransferase